MSASARIAVTLIGVACIVLAIYNAVTPDRIVVGFFGAQSDGTHARLIVNVPLPGVLPVRSGDELDVPATTLEQRIAYFQVAQIGSRIVVPIVRSGRHVDVPLVVPPGMITPPRWIDLLLVILEFAFSVAVMTRAGSIPLARMVVWLAIVEEAGTVAFDFAYTAPSPALAFAIASLPAPLFECGTSFVALWAVAMLPGGLRRRNALFAVAIAVVSLILAAPNFLSEALVFAPLLPTALFQGVYAVTIAGSIAAAVACAFVAQAAPLDQRMRSMWFVSTLIGWFIGSACGGLYEFFGAAALFWISYLLQSFTLLGPIYATLRHRILDLNFVITRSAIYAVLSVAMVSSFAGAEWLAGKLADTLLAGSYWRGIAAQLVSFAAALVIGLYLRTAHEHLERWVNALLFRDRLRKLEMLESFARESDLIDTRADLLRVTYGALVDSIDADGIALYVADTGELLRAYGSDTELQRIERSDRLVLQLLERQRSFVSEVPTLNHWLIVPLAVRREILGAIVCAPKRDRTAYLPDELRALTDVAQHVATSYALLSP
jgi:hypothetical protein